MTSSNRLFGIISTIYTANTQRPIFWLLRNNPFATAHLPIIYLLQIDQLFHRWISSNHFLLRIEILYDTYESPIRKHFDDLYDYCAKHTY